MNKKESPKRSPKMQVEYVDPACLVEAPYNPRTIDEEGLRRLALLLDSHGFVDPVIARREDFLIIGGHQRIKAHALRKNPDAKIPVIFLDGLSDRQAMALNVALNNPAAQGQFDEAKLGELLEKIGGDVEELLALTAMEPSIPGEMEMDDLTSRLNPPPPKMAWVLVAIPTVAFSRIAPAVEMIAADPQAVVRTTVTSK